MTIKKPTSILIVDDEPEIRDVLQRILSRKHEVVDVATDGADALEILEKKSYDLLMVDLNMPKVTGQQLVRKIRESGDKHTIFIILTGHGTFKEAHDLLQDVGISDFLNKPPDRLQLIFSVERALREQQLTYHLDELVAERTDALRASQAKLVQSEKMASLGRVVAGVAHGINTPLGITLMSISNLGEAERNFSSSLNAGGVSKKGLDDLLQTIRDAVQESETALGEANRVVSGFKQLAVDQTRESKREFPLFGLIEGVFSSLHLDESGEFKTIIDCPDDIVLNSFPGALGQVLTNLAQNSLLHGFNGNPKGTIAVQAEKNSEHVVITFGDDGVGMEAGIVSKIFDPFFTSKINQGSNGIGMSVSFNLVNEVLGGAIECQSEPGNGATFIIRIPLVVQYEAPGHG